MKKTTNKPKEAKETVVSEETEAVKQEKPKKAKKKAAEKPVVDEDIKTEADEKPIKKPAKKKTAKKNEFSDIEEIQEKVPVQENEIQDDIIMDEDIDEFVMKNKEQSKGKKGKKTIAELANENKELIGLDDIKQHFLDIGKKNNGVYKQTVSSDCG